MSAMQKVLRWGRDDLALSAAATLLRDGPDKLWRRIGCIAYEDIDVASLSSAANVDRLNMVEAREPKGATMS